MIAIEAPRAGLTEHQIAFAQWLAERLAAGMRGEPCGAPMPVYAAPVRAPEVPS